MAEPNGARGREWPVEAEREWWLSGDDRDLLADEQDRLAGQNTDAGVERDRTAEGRDDQALKRHHVAAQRIVATLARLRRAEIRDAHRWAEALAVTETARAAYLSAGTEQARVAWERADRDADNRIADLVEAGIERDTVRADVEYSCHLLAAAADDRQAAADYRVAAHHDRQAAALDRRTARYAREQAAIDRAQG